MPGHSSGAAGHAGQPPAAASRAETGIVVPRAGLLAGLLGLAFLLTAVGLAIGPVPLPPARVLAALFAAGSADGIIVTEIRLPRVLLALLVGAALALSGAALQGLMRNPLAEPAVIGTSGFAALGAVIALYFGLADRFPPAQPLGGIAGALTGIVLLRALTGRDASAATLILAGVALGSLAGSGVALALNLAPNPFAALEIAFWLLGSLEDRSFLHVGLAVLPLTAGCLLLLGAGRALDALSLGEDVARSLGVSVGAVRVRIVVGVGLAVGAAVAVTGLIGFLGLVVPHLIRPLVGHRPAAILLPSALAGACLLLAADILVRVVPTATELKIGIVTALIGVPFFLALIVRARHRLI
ncbi:MAG: FecCD family ABC transporter permease [Alphaproteobacteria bacterium]